MVCLCPTLLITNVLKFGHLPVRGPRLDELGASVSPFGMIIESKELSREVEKMSRPGKITKGGILFR